MPAGIDVLVQDGFASIAFIDRSLKPAALARLLASGGPGSIRIDTRSGPQTLYIVPEGNARAAGLLDEPKPPEPPAEPSTAATEPKKRGPGRPRKSEAVSEVSEAEKPETARADLDGTVEVSTETVRTGFLHD